MVKKTNKTTEKTKDIKIEQRTVAEVINNDMPLYSSYVILHRAIPDFRDGLKPVHRRIVYQMHLSKLEPSKAPRKSVRLVGDTMGRFHPHGDSSIYEALAGLSQTWKTYLPLVNMQGNNGNINGDGPAAPRYTESRQAPATANFLLPGLDQESVDFRPNYDNSEMEPKFLPAALPLVLVNGTLGIAYGKRTDLLPHNPVELLNLALYMVDNPNPRLDTVKKYVPGPDLPTGGIIYGEEGINGDLMEGVGKMTNKATHEVHETARNTIIEITSIPYGITTTSVIESIITAVNAFPGIGIQDIDDDTSKERGVSIKLTCDKLNKSKLDSVINYLYAKTKLAITLKASNLMIVYGVPKILSVVDTLSLFLKFRISTLVRIWEYEKKQKDKELWKINTLLKTLDLADEIADIGKRCDGTKANMKKMLLDELGDILSEEEADYISDMPIRQLGKQKYDELNQAANKLKGEIDDLLDRINNEKRQKREIKADLRNTIKQLKALGYDKRKTQIIADEEIKDIAPIAVENLVEEKDAIVIVKRDLQVFRIGERAYENQIKDYKDDDIVAALPAKTTNYVVIASRQGKAVTRFVNDLPNLSLNAASDPLNLVMADLSSNDEFVGAVIVDKDLTDDESDRMITLSKFGYMKVMPATKIVQNTNTKTYIKKGASISSMKKAGDEILYAWQIPVANLSANNKIVLTLEEELKTKVRNTTKTIAMSSLKTRVHGNGGSGFLATNLKEGKIKILNVEIILT